MKITLAVLFFIGVIGTSIVIADDEGVMAPIDQMDVNNPIIAEEFMKPVFDFPISRALGIDVKMLRRMNRPSINDLAVPGRK